MRVADLFAGLGGWTESSVAAGAEVVFAANHWSLAVEVHSANHKGTRHECQDLRQYPWHQMPQYDVLVASPACQGVSPAARGARKFSEHVSRTHDSLRSTAWAVVDCIEVTRPKAAFIENVPDFLRWSKYPAWKMAIETDGYVVREWHLNATWFGVPQRRNRLFISATRKDFDLSHPGLAGAEPDIGSVIRWNEGVWRPIDRARPAARERILRARDRFGSRCLSQHVTGHPGIPTTEAIRTITTKDQWVVVDGDSYRPLLVPEVFQAMGFRSDYIIPKSVSRENALKLGGNAVCPPVGKWIIDRIGNAI
jgi:DNA (cytosine-5)-methyltransferase 1